MSAKTNVLEIPKGFKSVPIYSEQVETTLQICVLVRLKPDPVGGRLVRLRELFDGQVLLGCVMDGGGRVFEWVELWIQNLDALSNNTTVCREALSNSVLDSRWEKYARTLEQFDEPKIIRCGWETTHPAPIFIDVSEYKCIHPVEGESGGIWQLCLDDGLLEKKQLPPYNTTLHRYLYLPEQGGGAD